MSSFTVRGIDLEIPDEFLSDQLIAQMNRGQYEAQEAEALRKHLAPHDRFADFGAGAGYLCAFATSVVGPDNVLGIEANPGMVPVAQANLSRNGGQSRQIRHGAVVADEFANESVRFLARKVFWSGHIDLASTKSHPRHVDVPALRIGELLAEHQPTVIVMDIEGGEVAFTEFDWPSHVRMAILEVHTKLYGGPTLNRIFSGFFANGFTYCPWGSRGETVIFERPA